jgi:hypothetical protein
MRGYRNFWLYKGINNEIGLGYVYRLNIALLVLSALYILVSVSFGWARALYVPIAICNAALCACQIPAVIFSEIYQNLEYYNKRFVLLAGGRFGRGFHSSFYVIGEVLGLLAMAIHIFSLAI